MRLLALLSTLGLSLSAFADSEPLYLVATDTVSLSIPHPELKLAVSYPGPSISGICGIEIRATKNRYSVDITKLFTELEISTDLGIEVSSRVLNLGTIAVDLNQDQTYGVWFTLRTKSGRSLQSVIARSIGPDARVTIVTTTCR